MLERLLAHHCAPALTGIKPANIVACPKSRVDNIHCEIQRLNRALNGTDIYVEILCECERRVLIIAYRKPVLERHLQSRDNRAFLLQYGYSETGCLADDLGLLKTRLGCDNFPHEIGVFLGYPLHDIYGFIHHRDEGCLLTGEWKVYHNPEEAQKLFCRFKACKKALVRHVTEQGKSLAQVFCAA